MISNLILHQPVTGWTLLAARPRSIVEIVLFTLVTAISHKALFTLTATIVFALERKRPLGMTVTGFAAFGSKAEVVDLTALTVLACDAGLALTLASADVTLAVGGTQRMAVAPLTAAPALQVVEARVTGSAVTAGHVRQTVTLPGHGVTAALLRRASVGIACTGFAFVCWIGSQGISKKAIFASVTVEASSVIDAFQAFSCQAIAISNCVGVDVVIALTEAAKPHRAVSTQRVSKVAVVTELTPFTGGAGRTVGAHHLLCLRDDGTAGAPRTRAGLAVGGGARGGIPVVPIAALLAVGAGCIVSAVTNACLGVTGLAVSVAGTKHARAVRPETWSLSSVTREAHLTELPSVSHRTGAGLHPSGRLPRPRAGAC